MAKKKVAPAVETPKQPVEFRSYFYISDVTMKMIDGEIVLSTEPGRYGMIQGVAFNVPFRIVKGSNIFLGPTSVMA